ncbi:MAG: hypothetical protein PF513_06590, partial [Tenericutes bacterium]|nr:hypothetical protein [Mycoplasmatota bacterium]
MKKLWVLFLALFAVFGIVSCNNDDPTEIEYNLNEQLDVPSNLSVNESTKTLTWDAVENATRYNVYVDGVLETEVTGTSFDFSGITGDKLMFTVKAMAPTGMQNSNVSTTIAYVANRESEISQMKLSIQARDMGVSDEDAFASELVSKGMLSEDFDSMMDEMENMETVFEMTDLTDIYDELDQLLSTMDMDMVEALISSIIKVELKAMIQAELAMWNHESADAEYYQDEIQQLEDLLQFIEDEGDQAVKSAMIVIEYLVDVQNGIDNELITSMETIVNSEELSSANISALVSVKNDLVNNFKDNLPEVQDVIVLNSTLVAFMEVMTEGMDTSIVSIPKQSAQSLMSMELFFNFILEMDETYIGAFVDAGNALSPADTKPLVKENIKLMNQYLENNDVLIQQLNNIYTDAEKEDLFYDYYVEVMMTSYYDMMGMYTGMYNDFSATFDETIIEAQLDFDSIMILQESMGEKFKEILDAIVESDYAVIDAIYVVVELQETTQSQVNEVEAVMN